MEHYETATLELVTFDEDVITASESSNTTNDSGGEVVTLYCWSCGTWGVSVQENPDSSVVNYSWDTEMYNKLCG